MFKHFSLALSALALVLSACDGGAVISVNTPPQAAMQFPPPEGAQVFETTPVVLRGTVYDGASEGEPELEFVFLSDRDGELGRGTSGESGAAEIEAVTLTVGTHTITLQVSDRQGASGSASAELDVVPNAAPVLTVTTEHEAIFLEGEPVILEGTVGDADHEVFTLAFSAESATIEVESSPEVNGDGFEGTWFVVFDGVAVGEHAVVLRATDPLGKSGTVVTTFRVDACTDDDGDGYTECTGDCNDGDAAIAPGRTEQCNDLDDDCDGNLGPGELDDDGDGVSECDGDCNDGDAAISPDASEACDGLDGDCDGAVPPDEQDLDSDGSAGCDGDCGPLNPLVHPSATELCNGLDDNCDGTLPADEADADADTVSLCAGDCDDTDAAFSPLVPELCDGFDNDCDGITPAGESDADGDGVVTCAGDCDPVDPDTYLGAPELCDGLDNDCDGLLPSDELDLDADGATGCGGDCNNASPSVYPGAPEICDGLDDDCDGSVGPNELDVDGDGFWSCQGDCDDTNATAFPGAIEICDGVDTDCASGIPANEADVDGDGVMLCDGDCDDVAPFVYPGAAELCDGTDNDCDGAVPADEVDDDIDGFSECQGDCDDAEITVSPSAAEICDGIDTDCDGTVPVSEDDADADGWMICEGDCDDAVAAAYPGASEQCNQVDDDCDGNVPAGEVDVDGDGWAPCEGDCDDGSGITYPGAAEVCDGIANDCGSLPADESDADSDGWMECAGDCDDTTSAVFPGHAEICDALDNDCDGNLLSFEVDSDGDGYPPCGHLGSAFDCDDGDPTVYPGEFVFDTCDGIDNNCSGTADSPALYVDDGDSVDDDGDGWTESAGDCNDCRADINPGAIEIADGIDNDCGGGIDDGLYQAIDKSWPNLYVVNGVQDGTSQIVDVARNDAGDIWVAWYQTGNGSYYIASPTSEPWAWTVSDPLASGTDYGFLSLLVDGSGDAHLFVRIGAPNVEELVYATWGGGTWSTEVIDAEPGSGQRLFATFDDAGEFLVAHRAAPTGEIRVAEGAGSSWTATSLAEAGPSPTHVGAAAAPGSRAVAWYDPDLGGYASAVNEGASWVLETIPTAEYAAGGACGGGAYLNSSYPWCPADSFAGLTYTSDGTLWFLGGTQEYVLSTRAPTGTWDADYRVFDQDGLTWDIYFSARGFWTDATDAVRIAGIGTFNPNLHTFHWANDYGFDYDGGGGTNYGYDLNQAAISIPPSGQSAVASITDSGYVRIGWD